MDTLVTVALCILCIPTLVFGAEVDKECVVECTKGRGTVIARQLYEKPCRIVLPDLPPAFSITNIPRTCNIELVANCTSEQSCAVRLTFVKFQVSDCPNDFLSNSSDHQHCSHKCEYLRFRDGSSTDHTYSSSVLVEHDYKGKTAQIKLAYCYKANTFTARNIQMYFSIYDLSLDNKINYGPASVYMLSVLVALLLIAIVVVGCSPCAAKCLDPEKNKASNALLA